MRLPNAVPILPSVLSTCTSRHPMCTSPVCFHNFLVGLPSALPKCGSHQSQRTLQVCFPSVLFVLPKCTFSCFPVRFPSAFPASGSQLRNWFAHHAGDSIFISSQPRVTMSQLSASHESSSPACFPRVYPSRLNPAQSPALNTDRFHSRSTNICHIMYPRQRGECGYSYVNYMQNTLQLEWDW